MKLLTTTILVFAGALAIMIGFRMEQQTMAILTGTAVGFVVAAICVGAVAYVALNRKPSQSSQRDATPNQSEQRQSSFTNSATMYSQGYGSNYNVSPMLEYQPRARAPMGPALTYQPTIYGYQDPRTGQLMQQPMPMYAQPAPMPPQRRFTMIGANGQPEEIVPAPEDMQPFYDV